MRNLIHINCGAETSEKNVCWGESAFAALQQELGKELLDRREIVGQ